MLPHRSFMLEPHETQDLLDRLKEWRLGICPNGTLGSKACFVLDEMPSIVLVPESAKPLTTSVNTGSKWTCNLVDTGVISKTNQDNLLQTLADAYMIFKSLFQHNTGNLEVAHTIRVYKYATIAIDNIMRPTERLNSSIQGVLSEPNDEMRWNRLMGFWDTFGYFWPRKITLGFKEHGSVALNLDDGNDRMVLKQQMDRMQSEKDPYDLHDFINNAIIVGRGDLTPIHELLHIHHRDQIKDMIQQRFSQISMGCHIKMYNTANDCYLAWSPRHDYDNYVDDLVVRPLSGNEQLSTRSDKQYLWQLASSSSTIVEQTVVRGGSCIRIHPSCKTRLRKQVNTVQVDTQNMTLVCQQSQIDDDPKATIRPLRLKVQDELLHEKDTTWRIEYPQSETQQHDIVDQYIHRLKPVVEGDIIQLKQIGFLSAFDTDRLKMTDKTYIQSLRKVKRIPQLDGSKAKSRKALMCIDQQDDYFNNTYWSIQLATVDDIARHHNGLKDLTDQSTFESSCTTDQESELHYYSDTSITTSLSINKQDSNNNNNSNHNRAQYFENLAKTSASQLLANIIKKATIDPFNHIIQPLKIKISSSSSSSSSSH